MRIPGAVVAVAAALAMIGCGKKEEPKPVAPAAAPAPAAPEVITVKIGSVAPLTGGIAHLGKDNENGVRLAIDEANAEGMKIGGKAVKFEVMSEDDQADPKVGNTVAQKLVDAKVAGVVGHLNSGTTIPASAIYNQAGIPMISGSATNPALTEQGFKTVFRVVGRDDQQGPAVANYLLTQKKPKVAAVIDDATAYGEGLANEVEKTLKAAGVQVLPREKGTDKTVDWKAVLTKIKAKKPDVVFYGGMDATGGPLLKQARELKIGSVFSFGDGACTDKMAELAGEAAEGLICSQAGIPVQAAGKRFLEGYKAKFNIDPILYSPFTYDAAKMLVAAMQKADSADPAKYLPALAALDYNGASGNVQFDAKGDRKDAEMTVFTLKGGKITPLAIIKGGKSLTLDEYAALMPPAPAPAAAPAAAPAPGK
ncbi:MAG: branched-chain amino acid ABC transporter substrate-binding protein [Candidatus Accumulibacter sp.]|uniref:branched-chain amino acid ABC transporter substrate-binding protein n=1 Tax=Accumulibacter sp. TaxID=2053492 RepID=UPI0025E9CFC4|nr:branched-chain amino acid ABC transporter substrate-binding protein [Accumulibacter sp.]MCM8594406.1 branched-chain amino acid ABC transporter substrate-binding protein [Accumulibacter sp.]MCM8624958.1 branched-chain amino acid ABC transporter substrate-binding protein [Accumulibacter sp.]MDS4048551.1 branched-chain amino acid ABC transporter substrate-binding protein [Accumulibacter sp.]